MLLTQSRIISGILLAASLLTFACSCSAQEETKKEKKAVEIKGVKNPFPDRPKVPSGIFEGGKKWLNTAGPISLKDVKGKIILVDFWTYCCINCIHVLPDLKYLEKKYPNELVVIGVHSAKFKNEKDSENIRRAIMRYEIEHPVINDAEMKVWRKFGVRSWPTLVVIDPEGRLVGQVSGEGNRKLLDSVVSDLITYHSKKGTLNRTPLKHLLEASKLQPTPLKFPGKVLADKKSNRLFIADSNHNRIIISSLEGQLIDIIGNGQIGNIDGSYTKASFDHPQGMTLAGNMLYVADTENHTLRIVDLEKKTVRTLAGTGKQARTRPEGGKLLKTALNSPWDLVHVDGTLFIAMAGPHQIWKHRLGSKTIEVHAGSGREDVLNGPLKTSALAQPSGIVSDGKFLYVCDSEGSSIRRVAVSPKGSVSTLVGESELPGGQTLFTFGDKDGKGKKVRLQHPLGIALQGKTLYIADTYNQKIKKIAIKNFEGKATSWLGDGKRGKRLNPARFSDPAGLSIAGNKLFIADTNNHRICVANTKTGKVTTFVIAELNPPQKTASIPATKNKKTKIIKIAKQTIAPSVKKKENYLLVQVSLKLPKGFHLNDLFPASAKISLIGKNAVLSKKIDGKRFKTKIVKGKLELYIPLEKKSGAGHVQLALRYSYCSEGKNGVCKVAMARWDIPFQIDPQATQKQLKLNLTAK